MSTTVTGDQATHPSDPWLPAWDGERYAANTGHHRVHDDAFLAELPLRDGMRVFDLGCGSGDFSRKIADLVPAGSVQCVDAQPSMVAAARRVAAPNQAFTVAAAQRLDEVFAGPGHDAAYDVFLSRAVLHWVPAADHPAVLASAFRMLRPGGVLRIECGGAGNVPVVERVLNDISATFDGPRSPWTFFSAGAYLELVEQAGFTLGDVGFVRTVGQRRAFDRESFAAWLHSQALMAYRSGIDPSRHAAFDTEVTARLDDFRRHDGSFDQTYARLDLMVRSPDVGG